MAKSIKNYNLPDTLATCVDVDVEVRPAVLSDVRRNTVTITYESTEPADQIVDNITYARDLAISQRTISAVRIVERRVIVMRPGIVR